MGVIEDLIASQLHKIALDAMGGGWGITPVEDIETDIYVVLKRGQDPSNPTKPIQICINYAKDEGIMYVSYEVYESVRTVMGNELGGYQEMFGVEIPLADPKSLQKVESIVNEYVRRANMNVGA